VRATWGKPALGAKERAEEILVAANQQDWQPSQRGFHAANPGFGVVGAFRNTSENNWSSCIRRAARDAGSWIVFFDLYVTSKSCPLDDTACCRNPSRTTRLIWFRATACFTSRFATAIARRAPGPSCGQTTNLISTSARDTRRPPCSTARTPGWSSRFAGGKDFGGIGTKLPVPGRCEQRPIRRCEHGPWRGGR
jgi:hypothetical protein